MLMGDAPRASNECFSQEQRALWGVQRSPLPLLQGERVLPDEVLGQDVDWAVVTALPSHDSTGPFGERAEVVAAQRIAAAPRVVACSPPLSVPAALRRFRSRFPPTRLPGNGGVVDVPNC